MIQEYMVTFKKLQLVKEIITKVVLYKLVAVDLSKQQVLDANLTAIQQNEFTGTLGDEVIMFFITEETKETILNFPQGIVRVFQIYFALI